MNVSLIVFEDLLPEHLILEMVFEKLGKLKKEKINFFVINFWFSNVDINQ